MLEGHFISLALDPDFAKINMPVYYVWKSIRSHTAPLFFAISGLVFTYLLLRDNDSPYFRHERVRKGIVRSLKLFFWGYILHLDLRWLLKGHFSKYFFSFHVLQCLGAVLLSIVILYGLYRLFRVIPILLWFGIAAFFSFILPSTMAAMSPDGIWPFFCDLFGISAEGSRFQSAFPLFPWLGYALFGGMLGASLRLYPRIAENRALPFYLFGIAVLFHILPLFLIWGAEAVLVPLGFERFLQEVYEFARFGRVLGVISLIMLILQYRSEIYGFANQHLKFFFSNWFLLAGVGLAVLMILSPSLGYTIQIMQGLMLSGLGHILLFVLLALVAARFVPWNFSLFLKIGQYTLPIYVLHVIVLYSGLFGIGLDSIIRKSMDPWSAVLAAAAFIVAFVYLVKYIEYFQWSTIIRKIGSLRKPVDNSNDPSAS